jgi:hypothetical protein
MRWSNKLERLSFSNTLSVVEWDFGAVFVGLLPHLQVLDLAER